MIILASCADKNVKDWTDEEIDDWFRKSKWNELPVKPDQSINKRLFTEQNILNPASWEAAYNFLKAGGFNEKELGRYELLNDGTYANIEEYVTKDSSFFEAHRKYIDIQYLAVGKEYVRVTSLDNIISVKSPYDDLKDIEFFEKNSYTEHLLNGHNFMVLFPRDAHMPCMKADSAMHVRKVVIKIPMVENEKDN